MISERFIFFDQFLIYNTIYVRYANMLMSVWDAPRSKAGPGEEEGAEMPKKMMNNPAVPHHNNDDNHYDDDISYTIYN